MMNCHFVSGSDCCARADGLSPSVAAIHTASINRSAHRKPSCMHGELSTPAIVDGLRCGRSYLARSREVALDLTASCPSSGVAGPGQTLRIGADGHVTITAVISGAPGTNVALITTEGCVERATVGSDRARLQWQLDAISASFARLEVREAQRRSLGAMVAHDESRSGSA